MEPSTEVWLEKEGPFLPLAKSQCGKWLWYGKEVRRQAPLGNASLTNGFQGPVLLPLHPSTRWDRSCCFPLSSPHSHHTLKFLGVCFPRQLVCSTTVKAAMYNWKSRKKERKKEKKKGPLLKTWREIGNKRLIGWFFHKHSPSKESICCPLTCENFLIKANNIRFFFLAISDFFLLLLIYSTYTACTGLKQHNTRF